MVLENRRFYHFVLWRTTRRKDGLSIGETRRIIAATGTDLSTSAVIFCLWARRRELQRRDHYVALRQCRQRAIGYVYEERHAMGNLHESA